MEYELGSSALEDDLAGLFDVGETHRSQMGNRINPTCAVGSVADTPVLGWVVAAVHLGKEHARAQRQLADNSPNS